MNHPEMKKNYIALLNFVKAFENLKTKQILRIEDCIQRFYETEIPVFEDYVQFYYGNGQKIIEDNDGQTKRLLSVSCPVLDHAPKVPETLQQWVEGNPDRFETDIRHISSVGAISFDADKKRVQLYHQWETEWKQWAQKQRKKDKVRKFFFLLRDMRLSLSRNSETYEFVVGNGIIRQKNNAVIHYPLVVQRLRIDFDSHRDTITICTTEHKTELEQDIFPKLYHVNGEDIKDLDFSDDFILDTKPLEEKLKILLHRLVNDGRVTEKEEPFGEYDDVLISMTPVFLVRKRSRKVGKMVEKLKEGIIGNQITVNPFTRALLGQGNGMHQTGLTMENLPLSVRLARSCGEGQDILLAKPANQQQLEIAESIAKNDVVVVQGPPGTGKTHTIANLLGHFLSEGKNILVTSERGKALKVLKGQMIEPLRDLCVSVTGETSDTIASVQGIMRYVSEHSEPELQRKIRSVQTQRLSCMEELNHTRENIFLQKNQQYASKVYEGQGYSVVEMADFVGTNEKECNYIPGNIQAVPAFPLTENELTELYQSNGIISQQEERNIDRLPDLAAFLSPDEVDALQKRRKAAQQELQRLEQQLKQHILCDVQKHCLLSDRNEVILQMADEAGAQTLKKDISEMRQTTNLSEWMFQCILDGTKGEAYQKNWSDIVTACRDIIQFFEQHCMDMVKHSVTADPAFYNGPDALAVLRESADAIRGDGTFSFMTRMIHGKYVQSVEAVNFDGRPPRSKEEIQLVWSWLTFVEKLKGIQVFWQRLVELDTTVPDFDILKQKRPTELISTLKNFTAAMEQCMKFTEKLQLMLQQAGKVGFVVPQNNTLWGSEMELLKQRVYFLMERVPLYLNYYALNVSCAEMTGKLSAMVRQADSYDSGLAAVKKWKQAIRSLISNEEASAIETYRQACHEIHEISEKRYLLNQRHNLLKKLKEVAPGWAAAIEERTGDFGASIPQQNIREAWKWKVFDNWIQDINAVPVNELQKKEEELSSQLRKYTGELCEYKAWLHVSQTIHDNNELQRALQTWQVNIKRLGKGTGKYADTYRKQARESMKECQKAIPVWIMPFASTFEMFDPSQNHFDIIIVDESSQSDLTALVTLGLADKVIIVGDDKQVSPSSIGIQEQDVERLKDQCLPDGFPIAGLLNAQVSLYDLAAGISVPIMLLEHFRCVPDIIGYSNNLSYDHRIKALRPANDTNLHPAVIPFRVSGGKRSGTTNAKEARSVAVLVKACCEDPAYKGKSIGVISLLSGGQADLIEKEISSLLSLKEIEERQILCGEAAQFQGDERDVIFLSMVDSAEDKEGALSYRSPENKVYQQRYNVAVSRARDQLWIVHSLDKDNDLKRGADGYDIRRGLLEYAENPAAYNEEEKIEHFSESPFEKEVCQYLQKEGFRFEQQWKAGAYRIDIVVSYGDNRVAVECDGARYHSSAEKVQEDMERQTILERLGWRFIRIRGTEFYRDKAGTMRAVFHRLEDLGIEREGHGKAAEAVSDTLIQSIETRAMRIVQEPDAGTISEPVSRQPSGSGKNTRAGRKRTVQLSVTVKENKKNDNHTDKPLTLRTDAPGTYESGKKKPSASYAAEPPAKTYGRTAVHQETEKEGQNREEVINASRKLAKRYTRRSAVGNGCDFWSTEDRSHAIIIDRKAKTYYEVQPGLKLLKSFPAQKAVIGTIKSTNRADIVVQFLQGTFFFEFPKDLLNRKVIFNGLQNREFGKAVSSDMLALMDSDVTAELSSEMKNGISVAVKNSKKAEQKFLPKEYTKSVRLGRSYVLRISRLPEQSVIVDIANRTYYEVRPGLRLAKYFGGIGTITQIDEKKMTLEFSYGMQTFTFPEALEEGKLSFRIMDNRMQRKPLPDGSF